MDKSVSRNMAYIFLVLFVIGLVMGIFWWFLHIDWLNHELKGVLETAKQQGILNKFIFNVAAFTTIHVIIGFFTIFFWWTFNNRVTRSVQVEEAEDALQDSLRKQKEQESASGLKAQLKEALQTVLDKEEHTGKDMLEQDSSNYAQLQLAKSNLY